MTKAINGYVDFVIRNRGVLLLVLLAATVFASMGLGKVAIDNDYRSWVALDNHERLVLNDLERTFERNDNVIWVLTGADSAMGDDFIEASLWLTEEAWKIPHVIRVASPTSYQRLLVEDDDIYVEDLVSGDSELPPLSEEQLKAELFADPTVADRLLSRDERSIAIIATVGLPDVGENSTLETTTPAKKLAAEFKERWPDITIHTIGTLMVNATFSDTASHDTTVLFPIMYGLFFLGIYAWIRSLKVVALCFGAVILSLTTTMGIVGWTGIVMNAGNSSAPTIVLTLVLANCVHVFTLLVKYMTTGDDQLTALKKSMASNFKPIFLTMLTTVLGFLALLASDSPPYRTLGLMVAAGIFTSWAYLMVFIPAATSLVKIQGVSTAQGYAWTRKMADLVIKHYRGFGIAFGAVALALSACMAMIVINDNPLHWVDKKHDFRKGYDHVAENFFGTYDMSAKIPARGPDGINDPEYMESLEKLCAWLRSWDDVRNVQCATEIVKRVNQKINGDDPAFYRIPETREEISQYILLYEFSLPIGHSLDNVVSLDKSATKVDIYIGDIDFATIRDYKIRVEEWIKANLPEYMHTEVGGPSVLFAYITDRNISSMAKSTLLVFAVITILIMVSLRDWRAGPYSAITNVLPLLMAYGFWGLVFREAGLAISIVAALGIGIIVDDTIHFLSKYFHAKKTMGLSAEDSIRYTFEMVGPALIGTSLILMVGFGFLLNSSFEINAAMGAFTATTVLFAILSDFILLPAVLIAFSKKPAPIAAKNLKQHTEAGQGA
ncbi:hypothetical protein A3709_20870 [Halioglobus sp. HI00S01]|uniref:efflux RND transporter permease subunit n=1 Tax=Halioglobus sp. HI00S01 TaxID=1822214 RepID=UPI0007C3BCC9|nr:MMPL family transporter [Halioglobus sp. HI00S01]KZX58067.1 hypothetical protein A3709_20870 [Halioglobus sp. HI00S01]